MNEPDNQPNGEAKQEKALLWLICAFIPSLAGISCLEMTSPSSSLLDLLLALNVGCSLFAGIGILNGMKDYVVRVILGLFLAVFLFVLNLFIVALVGCSGMDGRIAP